MFHVKESKKGLTFEIQVTPGASRAQIVGFQDNALKLKITAQPVEGAANIACVKLLSELLNLKKSQIEIFFGEKSRKKTVLVKNTTKEDLELKLKNILKTSYIGKLHNNQPDKNKKIITIE
jgi:uncharacterized protein (TIGR00251 family)